MSDHLIADGSFINSIVGEGTRFRGELDLNGLLRIDGDYTGTIRTPGKVLVGKNGRAECTIKAGTVVIGGVVKGDIFATEKVIILSTGMIIGNITCPRLIVEEGVLLDGNCTICAEERAESTEQKEEEAVPEEAQFAQTAQTAVSGNDNGNSQPEHTENSKELSAWKG